MDSDRFRARPPVVVDYDGPNYGLEYMQERELRMLAILDAKALQHKAEQQAAMMRAANESKHTEAVKQAAMDLFDKLVGEGKKKGTANRAVKEKYGIPARTLREWRKKR